jgi:hypothetical protein
MYDKRFGNVRQVKRLAEMIHAIYIGRFVGQGNPAGIPSSIEQGGVDICLPVSGQTDLRRQAYRSSDTTQEEQKRNFLRHHQDLIFRYKTFMFNKHPRA